MLGYIEYKVNIWNFFLNLIVFDKEATFDLLDLFMSFIVQRNEVMVLCGAISLLIINKDNF